MKQRNRKERTTLLYRRISIKKGRRNEGIRKLPLKEQTNNFHKQDLMMNAKISE